MYGFINYARRGNAESPTTSGGTVALHIVFPITGMRPSWTRVQRSVDLNKDAS